MKHRGYTITPTSGAAPAGHAWSYAHEDYDGPEDPRHGYGASPQDCKDQIDDRIERHEVRLDWADAAGRRRWFTTVVEIDDAEPFTEVSDRAHEELQRRHPECDVVVDEQVRCLTS